MFYYALFYKQILRLIELQIHLVIANLKKLRYNI